jgi:integrase
MVQPDKLVIPARLCKNGREHHVPIGPLAQTILSTRPKQALLFPAKSSRNKDISGSFNGFSKCKAALNERCGVTGWTLHDLRRTFASGMASLGVSLPVIEKMLNHVSGTFGGIVGVYQRYDFMPEMREAMAKWDEHIRNLVAGG